MIPSTSMNPSTPMNRTRSPRPQPGHPGDGPVRRGRALRRAVIALALFALIAVGCTPEQYQAWWTSLGNPPLREPALSAAAGRATAYWQEVARQRRFSWSSSRIDAALADRMTPTSWRPGCPVPLSSLRYLRVSHMDFSGRERTGELVVHESDAMAVAIAFKLMWDARFPIERMHLVDDYGGSDDRSMKANNTSAFNCRPVAGSGSWSQHAYGRAIDINPAQNPYVSAGTVQPPAGRAYLDRRDVRPGMLVEGSAGVAAFDRIGWGWGGRWRTTKDHQHVSASGR